MNAMKKIDADYSLLEELAALRRSVRFQTLTDELGSTPVEHQIIRPMGGQELRDSETQIRYVKNGQNSEMCYTQVHYLKGFFLLHHLCDLVGGPDIFFRFLRHYIHDLYHGKLVHSTDFLTLYFDTFCHIFSPKSSQEMVREICQNWLDTETLPNSVMDANKTFNSGLSDQVNEAFYEWKTVFALKQKPTLKRKRDGIRIPLSFNQLDLINTFFPEQLLMFLELLLRCESLDYKSVLKHLNSVVTFEECNGEIQHRISEIIVKAKFRDFYPFLKNFLVEHQALGVYLYGEIGLANHKPLKVLGKEVFMQLRDEYDPR